MIHYIQADLFSTDCDIICHGVNCRGGFGSGVAGQIAKKYPKARYYYLDKYEEMGWKLGEVEFVKQWDGKIIANCATQDAYLPRGICHVDYPAIEQAMITVRDYAKKYNKSVACPKIGAGLAGGDWNKIEQIINKVFDSYDIFCYYM